ncbi:PAN2-PAN3 deadenylation complex catalytic subunit PAN2 isoform X2 [Aethina tumida]|uniref:PAN2-PAN3 deadenylation complex catalytic subunit PAN2 isoform X2 n=1 Tax=Aethina tumida TaxID=116153 RepID=UPI0021495345|nr:PAN2-PAN3 deadenylation complex catalytic subunit PAN2 isoform X2 [Aethina tumida]
MYFDQSGLAVVAQPENQLVGLESEYIQTQCVLADGGDRFGVSSVTFDKHEELLWMGNQGGHVTSYYTGAMQKYTSFQVHATEEIRQIVTFDEGILALTASTLRCQIRRGIPVYTHMSTQMQEMQCMLQMSPTRLLMGGHQDKLIDFNLNLCKETMSVDVGDAGCVMLRPHSRFVCAGNPLGRIDLRDPNNLKVEHTLETHSGSLSDFDVQGNLLITCGFSNRHGNLAVDRFLMVYDLRMLRAVSPMQTVLDPMYLRFIPSISSRLAVVSALGQVQLLDTIALAEPKLCLLQMENPGAMCLAFDISSTSQAIAFGDNSGHIHLFGTTEEPIFNSYSRLTEHADPVEQYHSFTIDDYSTPLSVIPMPIVPDIPLASDWPPEFMQNAYRKPQGIDAEIVRSMKMQGPIGYAPNPKTSRRNQVMYDFGMNGYSNHTHINKSPKHHEDDGTFIAIPKRYRKVDVKYNKLGSDDFQFDLYNKTGLTGLEATLPNAYCNSMIQVLYYTEPLRAALLSHLCNKEFCLSCELGFLFHMLSTASQNQPCQPGNFLRAFRTVPEASALGLILSDLHPGVKVKTDLSALIQSWNRFMLHQMHVELVESRKRNEEKQNSKKTFVYKETDFPSISNDRKKTSTSSNSEVIEDEQQEEVSEISQLFGTKQLQKNTCLKCGCEVRKESVLLACNLVYPTSEPDREEWSFCDILARSLCPQQTTPAWCDTCSKFAPTLQTRIIQSLPKLLAINTGLHNPQHKQFWQTQMDKVVAKMSTLEPIRAATPTGPPQPAVPTPTTSSKPCRYGDNCTRPGCRFRHSFDNAPPSAPLNNPYCSNNWLPHSIELALRNDELKVRKLGDNKEKNYEKTEGGIKRRYELTTVVCYINDQASNEKRNLVALIKVPESYLTGSAANRSTLAANAATAANPANNLSNADPSTIKDKWYLFNDFSICPIPMQEAVWFSLDWKTPCVLYYSTSDIIDANTDIFKPLTREVFTEDACIARSGGTAGITFTPLHDNELLAAGDLVAMDAEFVTLNQEEAELRSDGKMSTIKPSQMSVARITCIRGQGSLEGTPFIDDYISTQEQVVDYLTKFSGIKPGDLDANFSSKHLTTLKSTYTKLRFLLDSGVIFVGHGLKNDFRVINLVVPPEQVADTVLLFHLPHHRMVSLRFLAWHFLGIKIQSETHDSIEDARAALQLYKKYKQLEAHGKIGEELGKLYEAGKTLNWRVPES